NALSHTLQGSLLRNSPAASSCYPSDPFQSPENYTDVKSDWTYASYNSALLHTTLLDRRVSITRSTPTVPVYRQVRLDIQILGDSPSYIVNATTEIQIATAMRWAFQRNIRIVVKGTGHDLNGRPIWKLPGCNETADVMVLGSGNNWGSAGLAANIVKRAIAGGEDSTVGLGGLIQNGGHGWLSSHYRLEPD
ncbi:FAD-binding type 2, partial [Penicillium longicatenatum]